MFCLHAEHQVLHRSPLTRGLCISASVKSRPCWSWLQDLEGKTVWEYQLHWIKFVSLLEIQKLHQLGSHFLAKLFGFAEPFFLMWITWEAGSSIFDSWGIYVIACLKGIFLFRSTHQSSESNSTIISVLSVFFCDLIVGLECWGRERTTLSLGEGGGCANFFCQSRKLVSPHSLIRQLLLSLDLLSGGEHAHRLGFFLQCRTTPAVFTEGTSLLAVEMLICCFQHKWGTGKDMFFLSSFVCSGISATCHDMSPLL